MQLDISEFYKKTRGINPYCKSCYKEHCRRYREDNQEVVKATKKKYYLQNRDKCLEAQRKWREKHKDYNKEYYHSRGKRCLQDQQKR